MPRNSMRSAGESINHYNAMRLRVIGGGDLQVEAYTFSGNDANPDVLVETLIPYTMASTSSNEPTLLMNSKKQRLSLKIFVTEENEWFEIQRIVLFAKPLFSQVPGRG